MKFKNTQSITEFSVPFLEIFRKHFIDVVTPYLNELGLTLSQLESIVTDHLDQLGKYLIHILYVWRKMTMHEKSKKRFLWCISDPFFLEPSDSQRVFQIFRTSLDDSFFQKIAAEHVVNLKKHNPEPSQVKDDIRKVLQIILYYLIEFINN